MGFIKPVRLREACSCIGYSGVKGVVLKLPVGLDNPSFYLNSATQDATYQAKLELEHNLYHIGLTSHVCQMNSQLHIFGYGCAHEIDKTTAGKLQIYTKWLTISQYDLRQLFGTGALMGTERLYQHSMRFNSLGTSNIGSSYHIISALFQSLLVFKKTLHHLPTPFTLICQIKIHA